MALIPDRYWLLGGCLSLVVKLVEPDKHDCPVVHTRAMAIRVRALAIRPIIVKLEHREPKRHTGSYSHCASPQVRNVRLCWIVSLDTASVVCVLDTHPPHRACLRNAVVLLFVCTVN